MNEYFVYDQTAEIQKNDIRTAIVCIAANENLYIRDFVKWHLKLGFTKIFIADNSPVDGEHPDFILSDFIDSGQVEIICLYKHKGNPQFLQMIFYSIVYEQHHHEFDWMFFIDVDEFVMFNGNKYTDVSEWLSQEYLQNADEIRLNWMCFGDNDQLYYDNRPVWKRFPKPMADVNKNDWCGNYPLNGTLKSAIRCTAQIANFIATASPHWAAIDNNSNSIVVSPSGKQRPWNRSVGFIDYDVAYLAHYRTLTITEYLHRRIGKQFGAQATGCVHSKDVYLKQFTTENEMTLEKQAIWDAYFERFEREHPGIFDQKNLVGMTRPTDDELNKYISDVRAVVMGEAEWTY